VPYALFEDDRFCHIDLARAARISQNVPLDREVSVATDHTSAPDIPCDLPVGIAEIDLPTVHRHIFDDANAGLGLILLVIRGCRFRHSDFSF
jgi:hypothetical protein